ncbi:hypothetical protein [Glutamicibacter creatinolyticus]|uniref:VG15 protein n=1 Tax=Glutamicibacter creatinolyticus TaxID=162496 RepID=UPI00321622C6
MSAAVLEKFTTANDAISARVDGELRRVLGRIDLANPAVARSALFEAIPPLVERWGDVAAVVAAEWFEQFRAVEGASGPRATLAPKVPEGVINGRLGFATRESGHLFAGQTSEFANFLSLIVNEYVLQPGHDTVAMNSARSKARYARVPEPGACAFCLTLASRGFVYTKSTVTGTKGGERYHGYCRCKGMPVWDETRARVVYGYDPEGLLKLYKEAAEESGRDVREVTHTLREQGIGR